MLSGPFWINVSSRGAAPFLDRIDLASRSDDSRAKRTHFLAVRGKYLHLKKKLACPVERSGKLGEPMRSPHSAVDGRGVAR